MKALLLATLVAAAATGAEVDTCYPAIHVHESDPKGDHMSLSTAINVGNCFESKSDSVVVELVVYRAGRTVFLHGRSPVSGRTPAMSPEMDNLTFVACGIPIEP